MQPVTALPPQYELITLEHVDSVLAEAGRRAAAGADEGTLIWAATQTDARTTSGARWYSPEGNLHCAVILRPDYPRELSGQLLYVATLAAGSALAGLLSPMTGLRYAWPNKLLVNELDAGRIMMSAAAEPGAEHAWLALAFWINVAAHPPNPEPETFNSVHASGAPEVGVEQLLEDLARWFLSWINRWADEGFAPIRHQWQLRAEGMHHAVELALANESVRGTMIELDEQGALIVETTDGGRRIVTVGEYFGFD
ncbi:MAG: biotin/lipoate--protein ligase family protein [Gammaproteobacteria bacterium]|nr:biotin/lipoate--protein ligase family protein [Gammaproteobacteria bacterium]